MKKKKKEDCILKIITISPKTIFTENFSTFQSRRNLRVPRGGKKTRESKRKKGRKKRRRKTQEKEKNFARTIARSSVVNDTTARWILLSATGIQKPSLGPNPFFRHDIPIKSPEIPNDITISPTNPLGALPEDTYYTPISKSTPGEPVRGTKGGEFGEGGSFS